MQDIQLYILFFGTAVLSATILLNYFQQKNKKKRDEERKNAYLKCKSLYDFEQLAKKFMMSHRFYYYDYKTGQGHTYQACRDYFDKQLRLLPRVLLGVTEVSLETTILGCIYQSPIMIAPTAFHCLAHIDGEVGTARGAEEAQCIYMYNWLYSTTPEEKVLQTTGPKFLHVYLNIADDILERIVSKAEQNGYRAIVVTCDDPTYRIREYVMPLFVEATKQLDPNLMQIIINANMKIANISDGQMMHSVPETWTNIERLRKWTTLPIVCKGILSPLDAELAIKYGANGIIVSSHGGRQVDTAVSAIECLEDIINAVDGRAEGKVESLRILKIFIDAFLSVFVDTGIRSGVDVLKALALGARAVLVGRPVLYGLACGGHEGVRRVLDMLKRELSYDMACCGFTSIDQINKDILYKRI